MPGAPARVRCSCGLVEHRRDLWRDFGSVWGWPDFLLEHSLDACVRMAHPDGSVLHGPPMMYGPKSRERNAR